MKLIADAGSTKTDWIVTNNSLITKQIKTKGINPFYQTESDIIQLISTEIKSQIDEIEINEIYFYGAGCTTEKQPIVANALKASFTNAKIEVDSDLLAAARALCGHSEGIACILGTGSNSCLYDGKNIIQNTSPLGFILGDEGSGAYLGKTLVSDFLKRQMPDNIADLFANKYRLTTKEAVENVYRQPLPNRYLAQFTPFLSENIAEPYCYNLVFDSFIAFFARNIVHYPDFRTLPIAFTGSVAYHFADVLEVAAYDFGLNFSHIAQAPIDGLAEFHKE